MTRQQQKGTAVSLCKALLLDRLNSHTTVKNLLTHSIREQTGGSALLIGARGSGKSILVRQALQELRTEHPNTLIKVVMLNGLLLSDSQVALRHVMKKLNAALDDDDGVLEGRSADNVLSSSHGNDNDDIETQRDCLMQKTAFDKLSAAVKVMLAPAASKGFDGGEEDKKMLVFILDEFDRFTMHPQQTLLYNLLELANASNSADVAASTVDPRLPVFVFGLTCRIDAVELMEKRVKSRFSQNVVYLRKPDSFDDYMDVIEKTMLLPEKTDGEFNRQAKAVLSDSRIVELFHDIYNVDQDFRPVFRILSLAVASLDDSAKYLSVESILRSAGLSCKEPLTNFFQDVNIADLTVLVAAFRLRARHGIHSVTLGAIMSEFKHMRGHSEYTLNVLPSARVLEMAFERLISARVLLSSSSGADGKYDKAFKAARIGVHPSVIPELVVQHPRCPDILKKLVREEFK